MKKRIRYTDEPLGKLKIVPDFLPHPDDLVFRDKKIKVTTTRPTRTRAKAARAG